MDAERKATTSITSMTVAAGEDCPLCCEPLSKADQQYPLHCPTAECKFQFCFDCLNQLAKSASDGYTEASDGSNQVKVALQCPQCRGEYRNKDDEFLKPASIVRAVLQLRQAASTPLPGAVPDSELSATLLSHRKRFLEDVGNVKVLQDDRDILQKYNNSLPDRKKIDSVPALDWEAWRPHLEEAQRHAPIVCASSSTDSSSELVLPRDPTLFLGLEDLMTSDEQEFITSMLVSGQAETLAQAANLLQNITQVSLGRQAASAVQQLSFHHNNSNSNRPSKAQLEHQYRVRQRFPLPTHMPRSVTLPLYDPVHDKKPALEFVQPKKHAAAADATPELTLSAVRGPAGKVGLRKADVVTHVNGEEVHTVGEFVVALQLAAQGTSNNNNNGDRSSSDFALTVNANAETALALRSRAQEMKKQGIRFY